MVVAVAVAKAMAVTKAMAVVKVMVVVVVPMAMSIVVDDGLQEFENNKSPTELEVFVCCCFQFHFNFFPLYQARTYWLNSDIPM